MLNDDSHFSMLPRVEIRRSQFNRSHSHKLSATVGRLTPIFYDEILPGDTVVIDIGYLVRMTTPLLPTMDSLFMDIHAFFVPNRLVWDDWKAFQGENNNSAWVDTVNYKVPHITLPSSGFAPKSLADYLGFKPGIGNTSAKISALPFRGYCAIWNYYYRNQNVDNPCDIYTDMDPRAGSADVSLANSFHTAVLGGGLLPVNKFVDYFTSCLPKPQKGDPVKIPIDMSGLPVVPLADANNSSTTALAWKSTGGVAVTSNSYVAINGANSKSYSVSTSTGSLTNSIMPSNLGIPNNSLAYVDVNDLRNGFALQRALEKDARSGTYYSQALLARFGVTSPDASLQYPEYLGGQRIPIMIDQVLQTSQSSTTELGTAGAFSYTGGKVNNKIIKSFTEHGQLYVMVSFRYPHTYQDAISKHWFRFNRFDYFEPTFSNLSEQPVFKYQICGTTTDITTGFNHVFGYQEAWAEYRYMNNRVSGELRSAYPQSLDAWHYADNYAGTVPTLSSGWMAEDPAPVYRSLTSTDSSIDCFICDFAFGYKHTRPMPVYSIPGLIDHN